ncbi:hypothetical protein N0V82_002552 [Gnomoniopsis sp. IMI 355080]|nr:hypothetical protein N0V82_002552 [Gnomoniopsis sp. IMI 355080]
MQRNRRGSVTSNAFSQLFQRSSSIAGTPVMPNAVTTAAIHEQRRRLSLSTTTLGITGTSPNSATGLARRASTSTNSDFDENAIEEDDSPTSSRTAPVTPFHHRMSFGAAAMRRPTVNSPGTANGMLSVQSPSTAAAPLEQYGGTNAVPSDPPEAVPSASAPSWKLLSSTTTQNQAQPSNTGTSTTTASAAAAASRTRPRAASDLHSATRSDQGFNWSEQLRSRAESTVASGSRPSFSFGSGLTGSPPRPAAVSPPNTHDRARSVSEMPAPPAQTPKPRSPPRDTRPKPDHFQERILKGDFYMD